MTSLITAVAPVWSLTAVTLRAPAPHSVLREWHPCQREPPVSYDFCTSVIGDGGGGLANGEEISGGCGVVDGYRA